MPRILHVGPDEPFLALAARQFEREIPGQNDYLVLSDRPLRFFPESEFECAVARTNASGFARIWNCIKRADAVIVHGMHPNVATCLLLLRPKGRMLWSGWGYDYYGSPHPYHRSCLLEPRTADAITALAGGTRVWRSIKHAGGTAVRRMVAGRVDYFSAPIPADYATFLRNHRRFRGSYLQLNYGCSQDIFGAGGDSTTRRGGILVGNSATPTNNHIDAFELLRKHVNADLRIIVPLGYGDRRYAEYVAAKGRAIFGASIVPIMERMPLREYNDLLGQCHIVLMYQKRQQGLGNVGTALYQGAHVYMHPASVAFSFLRRLGTSVRSTATMTSGPLPPERQDPCVTAKDREALDAFWGKEVVDRNTSEIVHRMLSRQ